MQVPMIICQPRWLHTLMFSDFGAPAAGGFSPLLGVACYSLLRRACLIMPRFTQPYRLPMLAFILLLHFPIDTIGRFLSFSYLLSAFFGRASKRPCRQQRDIRALCARDTPAEADFADSYERSLFALLCFLPLATVLLAFPRSSPFFMPLT